MEPEEKARRTGDVLRYLGAVMLFGDWNAGGIPFAFFSAQDENWDELALGLSLGTLDFAEEFGIMVGDVTTKKNLNPKAAALLADNMWLKFHKAACEENTVTVAVLLAPEADEGFVKIVVRERNGNILYQDTAFVGLEEDEISESIGQNRIHLAPEIVNTVYDTLAAYAEACQSDTPDTPEPADD